MAKRTHRSRLVRRRKRDAGPGPGAYDAGGANDIAARVDAVRGANASVRMGRTTGRAQASGPFGKRPAAARAEEGSAGGRDGDVLVLAPRDPNASSGAAGALPWSKVPRFVARGGALGGGGGSESDEDAHLRLSCDEGGGDEGVVSSVTRNGGVRFSQQLGRPALEQRDPAEGNVLVLNPKPAAVEPQLRGVSRFGAMEAERFTDARDAAERAEGGDVLQVCFCLPLHFKRILLTILTCPPHILTFKNTMIGDVLQLTAVAAHAALAPAVRGGTFARGVSGRHSPKRRGRARDDGAQHPPVLEFGSRGAGGRTSPAHARAKKAQLKRPHRYEMQGAFDDSDGGAYADDFDGDFF